MISDIEWLYQEYVKRNKKNIGYMTKDALDNYLVGKVNPNTIKDIEKHISSLQYELEKNGFIQGFSSLSLLSEDVSKYKHNLNTQNISCLYVEFKKRYVKSANCAAIKDENSIIEKVNIEMQDEIRYYISALKSEIEETAFMFGVQYASLLLDRIDDTDGE